MTVGRIPSVEGGIQPTIFDAKGDLLTATANDTPARLAVGANATMLVADSTAATGLKWQDPADLYPWTTWTPSWTNLTVGNGTQTARYKSIGKLIYAELKLTLGSTSSVGTGPYVSFPLAEKAAGYAVLGEFTDNGTASYPIIGQIAYGGLVFPNATSTTGTYALPANTTATVPFTWTTSDVIVIRAIYEAA